MKMTIEEKYMKAAIREAQKAWALGEVPIGCVIREFDTPKPHKAHKVLFFCQILKLCIA